MVCIRRNRYVSIILFILLTTTKQNLFYANMFDIVVFPCTIDCTTLIKKDTINISDTMAKHGSKAN